jgi:hypothetical protein
MGKTSVIDAGKTAQGIGEHNGVWVKMFARPASDLLNGEILDPAQTHGDRVDLQVGRYCCKERCFTGGAPASISIYFF